MKRMIFRRCALLALAFICAPVILPPCPAQEPLRAPTGQITSFAPIVEKVAPSVVTVFTTENVTQPGGQVPEELLQQLFGGNVQVPQDRETIHGLGSGVIVSSDGYILTASHVVANADEIMVGLGNDMRRYKAKKIGSDPGTDVALLKIDDTNLPAITFADSDKARPGDVVLAIGNPFGLRETVTMGIISAVGRGGMGIVDYENFIQTDAAINAGNSGGALVNTEGQLVGINSAILSRSGGYQGIGFAIPSNLASEVMQSLREKGRVVRGYIGTGVQTLTPDLADAFKLKQQTGALVDEVEPDSPAAKAGLAAGDVITTLNGKPIDDARQLRLMVGSMAPGTDVKVGVDRGGEDKTFDIVLAEMPAKDSPLQSESPPAQPVQTSATGVLGGVTAADINKEARETLNLPGNVHGAVVAEIDPSSPAAQAGLQEGDVIQEIDRKPVKSAEELASIVRKLKPGGKTLLRVWSRGRNGYLVVAPE